ncbi:ATPase MORC2-like [Heptranchias perlo]|uniref:ATPase MORC2-like n=1 Tax=Heptranchias perlo TaxID=212740 RepID=UPI0035595416
MEDKYHELSRAQLTCDYLQANSTTHEFLFGALAELVDNARDAKATVLNIYTEINEELKGGLMLHFLDDGIGMDPNEAADIIHLGKSIKKISGSRLIGQYGNGLKSGSMRIGMDFILFTKKDSTMTCILVSRTFYEKEGIDEVIVPVPSWYVATKEPITTDEKKFSLEIALIYKYSPFKTEFDVMQQFNKITEASGTLVIIYNLKLNDDGKPELDIETDPSDILLTGMMASGIQPECYSFRAYAAILYIDPRMKIFIQGQKVHAKHLFFSLYRPRKYTYISKGFKVRAAREAKEAELAVKIAGEKMQEIKFKVKELEQTCDNNMEARNRLRLANAHTKFSEAQRDIDRKKKLYQEKLRALKEPNNLSFIFGVNIEKRNLDGMFIYNNSRLIKMYKRIGVQLNRMACSGVVGVVDVPSVMMEPTHNKQDFADAKEYHSLLRVMGQFLLQYWKDLGIAQMGIVKFWNEFGYLSSNWNLSPSNALQYKRRRAVEIQVTVQCDLCLRWRTLPSNLDINDRVLPDIWVCSMNPNSQQNSCDLPEQLPHIPLGTLTRGSILSDERQQLLEKSIQRHWEKVDTSQFQKIFLIKPLTYKLPSDLSNKSIYKDIYTSETNPFPLSSSTRKRRIPSSYPQLFRRSESSESIPLCRNKDPKSSKYGKTIRIHGKSRPAAVSLEKRSYTSVHSTEENSIKKTFMASQPRKKHLQALQKEEVNTHIFKVEIPQRELAKETTEEIIAKNKQQM